MEGEEDSVWEDIDFSIPLWKNQILPRVFSFCSLKMIMKFSYVSKFFFQIARNTPISERFYCRPGKPLKQIFSRHKFQKIIIDSNESFKIFLNSLSFNHEVNSIKINSNTNLYKFLETKELDIMCKKKNLKVLTVSGSKEFDSLEYILKNSSIACLQIRKPSELKYSPMILTDEPYRKNKRYYNQQNEEIGKREALSKQNEESDEDIQEDEQEDEQDDEDVPDAPELPEDEKLFLTEDQYISSLIRGIQNSKYLKHIILADMVYLNNKNWKNCFSGTYFETIEITKSIKFAIKPTDDLRNILSGIKKVPNLKSLILDGFYYLEDKFWIDELCNILPNLFSLKSISLSRMGMFHKSFNKFEKALRQTNIENVGISWNPISLSTLESIADLIQEYQTLKRLNCSVLDWLIDENPEKFMKVLKKIAKAIKYSSLEDLKINPKVIYRKVLDEALQSRKENLKLLKKEED